MNPLVAELAGVLARWLLINGGAYGFSMSEALANKLAFGAVSLAALAWSTRATWFKRLKLVVAMSRGPITEDRVTAIAKGPAVPPVTTPKDAIPTI